MLGLHFTPSLRFTLSPQSSFYTDRFHRTLASSLYGFFTVSSGQSISVTYPRRTGGKRLDKNRMHMRALLFEIQRCTLML